MSPGETAGDDRARENRRMLIKLSVVALAMFGFGYALVPIYKQICEALGINYFVQPDSAGAVNSQVDRTRTLTIEFGGTTAPDDLITLPIPAKAGLVLICERMPILNSLVVRAFADEANDVIIFGRVERVDK